MSDDEPDQTLLRGWDDHTTADVVLPWTRQAAAAGPEPDHRVAVGGGGPGPPRVWGDPPIPRDSRIVPWTAAFGPPLAAGGTSLRSAAGFAPAAAEPFPSTSRRPRPTGGWRGMLYVSTGGRVNPGPSAVQARRHAWMQRITTPLAGCHEVTVVSMKGGVGKTTMAALLGLVLAEHRGDRVLALDANPDAGTLADRILGRRVARTVRDLLTDLDRVESLTDLARYTGLAGRLQVLASEQDPAMSEAFNQREYEMVMALLQRFVNVIITDSGTGVVHSAMRGALDATRTLILVGAPTVDAASRAAKTLDWLTAHGHGALVAGAVVALSYDRVSPEIDRTAVAAHFAARCREVVHIPADPHLAAGSLIELDRLHRRTLDAALALAAAVGDDFDRPAPLRPAPGYEPGPNRPRPR